MLAVVIVQQQVEYFVLRVELYCFKSAKIWIQFKMTSSSRAMISLEDSLKNNLS